MVDVKGMKGTSESLPREGRGTRVGPGRGLFGSPVWSCENLQSSKNSHD